MTTASFVAADDPETAVARIVDLVKTRIPQRFGLDPVRDIQVLCPMNCGGAGARSLNIELQAALNPAGERKVERFGWIFAPGDKVMQIENDYDKEVRRDARQAPGRLGRTEEGGRHRRAQRVGAAALVEAEGMAGRRPLSLQFILDGRDSVAGVLAAAFALTSGDHRWPTPLPVRSPRSPAGPRPASDAAQPR